VTCPRLMAATTGEMMRPESVDGKAEVSSPTRLSACRISSRPRRRHPSGTGSRGYRLR
jgi:hypothetical protein